MKRTNKIIYFLFAVSSPLEQVRQKEKLQVVIAGDYKEPWSGASIFVSSENLKKAGSNQTSLGVITDMDGKFTNVPEGVSGLQCSYVGYEPQTIHLVAGKIVMRLYCSRRHTYLMQ